MKTYILFYLIYWSIFASFVIYKLKIINHLVLVFKTIFGLRKFYSVTILGYRTLDNDATNFNSLDFIPARSYNFSHSTRHDFSLLVEDLSNSKEFNDKFYPVAIFRAVTENGQFRSSWHDNRNLGKTFLVAKENIVSMQPVKIRFF